jgi:tRNA-binding EMAP/Myf-like protein
METINFDEFKKIDIRVGKIISAEKVEGSDKLLKLEVDFGVETMEIKTMEGEEPKQTLIPIRRQIIAGIAQFYPPEALIGKECPFAYNLAPRMLKGLESQGMILCPSDTGPASAEGPGVARPVLLHPDKEINPGSIVK